MVLFGAWVLYCNKIDDIITNLCLSYLPEDSNVRAKSDFFTFLHNRWEFESAKGNRS